jgi:outer membrane protein OmpA-like peptidoglycan-associated protein
MRRYTIALFGGALALASVISTTARAQENGYFSERVGAPSKAYELKIGTGYTQGFGNLAPGRELDTVSGAGIGFDTEFDYRISRTWSAGVELQFQALSAGENSSVGGIATSVGGTYHFAPVMRGDPWIRLGSGYRVIWESDPKGAPGTTISRSGFDVAALKVGYDVRVSEDVALAPVVGADLNIFAFQEGHTMDSAQVGSFVWAGLQGRFDFGGERVGVEPPAPPKGLTAPQPLTPIAPVETKPASPSLAVSEDVARLCALNLDAVDKAPKFEFDKSDLQPGDYLVLKQIADCFTTGPMKDLTLRLVGRADPRGTVDYNDKLGSRRAAAVSEYLQQQGIDLSRIEQSSRGKLDAEGTDEATWAVDRRVDILQGR